MGVRSGSPGPCPGGRALVARCGEQELGRRVAVDGWEGRGFTFPCGVTVDSAEGGGDHGSVFKPLANVGAVRRGAVVASPVAPGEFLLLCICKNKIPEGKRS